MEAELCVLEGDARKPLAGSPFKDILYGSVRSSVALGKTFSLTL